MFRARFFPKAASTAALFLALVPAAAPARADEAGGGYWAGVAAQVIAAVDRAEAHARAGQVDDAKEAAIDAYFGIFEEQKMETAERSALGAKHMAEVEELFNSLRKAVGQPGAPAVPGLAETLRHRLKADAQALDAAKVTADGLGVGR